MKSVLNQGSTFSFYLPLLENLASENGQEDHSIRNENGKKLIDLSGKKILVAEDDSANYLFIESFLKRTKSQVIWAKDGEQLLEIFKSEPGVDLILMDLRMPLLNGIDTTRIIRTTHPDLPIIALTAYAFADDREKSIEAGCNDYLTKPVKLEELSETLIKYLQ